MHGCFFQERSCLFVLICRLFDFFLSRFPFCGRFLLSVIFRPNWRLSRDGWDNWHSGYLCFDSVHWGQKISSSEFYQTGIIIINTTNCAGYLRLYFTSLNWRDKEYANSSVLYLMPPSPGPVIVILSYWTLDKIVYDDCFLTDMEQLITIHLSMFY